MMRRHRLAVMKSVILGLCTLGLGLGPSGCDEGGSATDDPVVRQQLSLTSFNSCTELEQHIEDLAIKEMEAMVDGSGTYYETVLLREAAFTDALAPTATAGASADTQSTAPSAFTGTNNQVAGVDEPDFIKNDGTRILVLSGQTLYAAKSWPPEELGLAGKLEIEGWPQQMLFESSKNLAVVFSAVPDYASQLLPYPVIGGAAPAVDVMYCRGGLGCGYSYSMTKITVVDVSTLSTPKVVDAYYLPGNYTNARAIGASMRLVLSDAVRWPEGVKFWVDYPSSLYDGTTTPTQEEIDAALKPLREQLKAANAKLIRAQTLEDWLPAAKRELEDGTEVDLPYQCNEFARSGAPVHLGLTTVLTLNLDQPDELHRTTIVEQPSEIYASHDALYVTSHHWWWTEDAGQTESTYLHKFDITDPSRATYVASGAVDGYIVNQFAMDELDSNLRVATTINTRVTDPEQPWRTITTNRVTVLGEKDDALAELGRTPDLAEGERIQSARFLGQRGFVVTFRQVDPLFTLDLSDPAQPTVVGELKVPGFSTYIHPLDENHLLTIGVDVPDPTVTTEPVSNERHVKLSIFDVSDFANPKEAFTELVGTAYGWSEATNEHKAFNYFPERKLLAIPFSDYETTLTGDAYWNSFVSELKVFSIDVNQGITPRGALSFSDVYRTNATTYWDWYYSPWVRRSIMASGDSGHDYVYAIADAGIRVADLGSITTPLATLAFPTTIPELTPDPATTDSGATVPSSK